MTHLHWKNSCEFIHHDIKGSAEGLGDDKIKAVVYLFIIYLFIKLFTFMCMKFRRLELLFEIFAIDAKLFIICLVLLYFL